MVNLSRNPEEVDQGPWSLRIVGDPKPQARPRAVRRGEFSTIYSPKTTWYGIVYDTALKARPLRPITGPLSFNACFMFQRPKSQPKKNAPHYVSTKKNDLDNLIKAVWDAMTQAQWWEDDGQIASCRLMKTYVLRDGSEAPGVVINLTRIS